MNFNFPQNMSNDLTSNTKKPFIVVVNSNNKLFGNNNVANYNFDWFFIPDIPYKVSFSFSASDNNAYVLATAPTANIHIDFGECSQTFICLTGIDSARTTPYLGTLRKAISSGANYYLFANRTTNPPIYLNGRPNNKFFRVNILTDTGAGYDLSMLGSYVLTLYFEPV